MDDADEVKPLEYICGFTLIATHVGTFATGVYAGMHGPTLGSLPFTIPANALITTAGWALEDHITKRPETQLYGLVALGSGVMASIEFFIGYSIGNIAR